MLSPRNKVIILIAGAAILFALLVLTIFDLWPSRGPSDEAGLTPGPDLSFLDEPKPAEQGLVFDASNKDEFAEWQGVVDDKDAVSDLEREARDLAEFFVARLGTYSSDAKFSYIQDLQGYMTPSMLKFVNSGRDNQPERDNFFAVATDVSSSQIKSFSPAARAAQVALIASRTETGSNGTDTYQQNVDVDLQQNSQGEWLVNGVFWGKRE